MRHMALIVSLITAGLAACNQTTAEAPSTSHITDQQAFAAAKVAVIANLKDPDSARFGAAFVRKNVKAGFNLTMLGHTGDHDVVCGTVNSRNSFGGYSGMMQFAYRVGHKDIFVDTGGKNLPDMAGSIWCMD